MKLNLIVDKDDKNLRIDKYLSEKLNLSRNAVQKLIELGNIKVNEKIINKNYKVCESDNIDVVLNELEIPDILPEDIDLNILYEDKDLLVINKPKGMVVHPAPGHYEKTLVNAIMFHCKDSLSGINGVLRPGIVHRIDRDTGGLLLVAKNDKAHNFLAAQIKEHSLERIYEAVVYGNVKKDSGTIDLPVGRSKADRKKMTVTYENSRNAVTHFKVIERLKNFTHIEFRLETGRTHQIRVHMAHIGHPVAGDVVYGPKKVIEKLNGQCLFAKSIGFIHPSTKEYMKFEEELPDYFKKFILNNKIDYD